MRKRTLVAIIALERRSLVIASPMICSRSARVDVGRVDQVDPGIEAHVDLALGPFWSVSPIF